MAVKKFESEELEYLDALKSHLANISDRLGSRSTSPQHGQVTVGTSVVQLPDVAIPDGFAVVIKAMNSNSGKVYIGGSGVSTSNGYELGAGEAVGLKVSNLNYVYAIADTADQKVCWIVEG